MNDNAFESLADSLLETLEEGLDAERQGSVLRVEGEAGTWIVNKHAPTRQIWLSSPKSGARHYAFEPASGLWQDTRGGTDLLTTLADELGVSLDWQPE